MTLTINPKTRGLGNLAWAEVGSIMCNTLKNLDIHVCIYLPTEKKVATELLTADYLLQKT
ncbi:hypothetical protein [Beggiatoa alba]|uniref:hypothetical protein n=1 Tax=Beggiatoa alba TaxID=1022 RepID=UPI00058C1233|nr:hypothetical protein [Beggiatoa alba]